MIPVCPVCGWEEHTLFHRRRDVPALCNALCATEAEALAAPTGDVELVVCHRCSMVWNRAFDDQLVAYGAHYENSLHFSPGFQAFATRLASTLRADVPLSGTVVELGCGQGDFLELVCSRDDLHGVGIDPGFRGPSRPQHRVSYVRGGWEDAGCEGHADLVCARHVLEHMRQPADLLAAVRRLLRPSPRAIAYLEVPDADHMLDEVALWDVVYEHPLYFHRRSLRQLALRAGLVPVASGTTFGGQYLWVRCRPGGTGQPDAEPPGLERAAAFDRRASETVHRYEELLARARVDGRRVALWGTGSKGTTFLNVVAGAAGIAAVVDVNPRKHGLHVPGTGQQVIGPDDLGAQRVDEVIVLNPNYRAEVSASLVALGIPARVCAAV